MGEPTRSPRTFAADPERLVQLARQTRAETWPAGRGQGSRRSELAKTMQRLARNKGAVAGGIVLTLILLMAVFAPVLAPKDPSEQDYGMVLQPPGREAPMGTD